MERSQWHAGVLIRTQAGGGGGYMVGRSNLSLSNEIEGGLCRIFTPTGRLIYVYICHTGNRIPNIP